MHYYKFNIADYRKDTTHLNPTEHYIYRSLIDWYYLDEKPIPKETQSVIRRLSLGSDMVNLLNNVLSDFFVLGKNGYVHSRIERDIVEYNTNASKNKANGKLGGRPPKPSPSTTETQSVILANPNESERNPNHKLITNNHKPITNKYIPPIPTELLSDYSKLRKAKKAGELTETAFKAIEVQAKKAGITIVQAIEMCCLRGWVGFKSEWLDMKADREQGRQNAAKSIFKPEHLQHLQGNELKLVEGL